MKQPYRVRIEPPALAEIEEIYLYIAKDSLRRANHWFNGLEKEILTLDHTPARCPLAPENQYFEVEIRQLLYGQYRVLFTIIAKSVHVLHVRHMARKHLEPGIE